MAEIEEKEAIAAEGITNAFEKAKLGIWAFLATELMLFGGLFTAYAVYRIRYQALFHEQHLHLNRAFGRDMAAVLRGELGERIALLEADAATLEYARVAAASRPETAAPRLAVVGNLPYHLTSPILFSLLDQVEPVSRAVFLVQREVAERLAAAPGTKDWGILSVLLQREADVSIERIVPAGAFVPPPKVESAVTKGEACGVIESVKTFSDLYAPVSGTVLEINEKLQSDESLVNESPFEEGWMFAVRPSNPVAACSWISRIGTPIPWGPEI